MKIVQIICTRNEGDLLKQNIEFHKKAGVDFFLITDNASTDNTKEIILEFQSQGIAEYFNDDIGVHEQKENMERMAMVAYKKYRADWIILSDTDEFWFPVNGFKKLLNFLPSDINVLKVARYQHFPTIRDNNKSKKIYQRMCYRENGQWLGFDTGMGDGLNNFARKKVIFKPIYKNFDIATGNHTVHFEGRNVLEILSDKFIIHEFPFQSYERFEQKIMHTDKIFSINKTYIDNKNYATHWRKYLSLLKDNQLRKFYDNFIYFNEGRLQQFLDKKLLTKDTSLIEFDPI